MTFFSSSPRQYSFFCQKYSTFFTSFLLSFRHRIKTVNLKFKFTFSAIRLRRYRGDEKNLHPESIVKRLLPGAGQFLPYSSN